MNSVGRHRLPRGTSWCTLVPVGYRDGCVTTTGPESIGRCTAWNSLVQPAVPGNVNACTSVGSSNGKDGYQCTTTKLGDYILNDFSGCVDVSGQANTYVSTVEYVY